MQVSIVALLTAFAGVTMATPMSLHVIRACDLASCAVALGPAAVGCTGAVVEAGANPIADAGCIAGVLNGVVNTPAACAGCGSQLGISGAVTSAESAVGGAVNNIESAIGSIF